MVQAISDSVRPTCRAACRAAGYQGDVEQVMWTTSFNPLIDQINILGAKAAARGLADKITRYKKKYPSAKVHIVALSAGTGVAVWACEILDANTKVDNLVLLGSSLSNTYDMRRALAHINGRVFVYYSSRDAVLQTVEVVGTIDRKTGVKSRRSGRPALAGRGQRQDRPTSGGHHGGLVSAGAADTPTPPAPAFVRGEIGPRMLTPEERRLAASTSNDGRTTARTEPIRALPCVKHGPRRYDSRS